VHWLLAAENEGLPWTDWTTAHAANQNRGGIAFNDKHGNLLNRDGIRTPAAKAAR
jgi:hypothetical protein